MTGRFRVDGSWPSPITLRRGWGEAVARPWNGEVPDAFLRLLRGRSDFLEAATTTVARLSGAPVLSPAVFEGSTRIWERAGYREVRRLDVMERSLTDTLNEPRSEVREAKTPDWDRILTIDQAAFEGYWRMSGPGLAEALDSTRASAVLVVGDANDMDGYAIVGSQWGIGYLQRVAVHPETGGRGLGTDLVRAALRWGARSGAGTMVLNVREENERAKRLYRREGLADTGTQLRILRHGGSGMLD